MSMKTIRLYGEMRKKFGKEFRVDVATPREAVAWLCRFQPGFRAYLQERLDAPFRVLVGRRAQDESGLHAPVGRTDVIRLVPVVAGAKDGWGQILTGVVLLAAVYFSGGSLAPWAASLMTSMGTAMVLGGVAQVLAGTPQANTPGDYGGNDAKTWTFGGPTLTVGQGGCVPVLYGKMRIGGHVISAGIDAHAWGSDGFGSGAPDTGGTGGTAGGGDHRVWVREL